MKTLYVVRHAKSSWDDPELSDFERPLNARGKRDAPDMGKRLKEKGVYPGCVIASPAKRAYGTAKRICEVIGIDKGTIKKDRGLYHASEDTILGILREIKPKYESVMIFGHNPGLTDFVNMLMSEDSSQFIENVPTCGIVAFSFKINDWRDLDWKTGNLLFFDYPKKTN